MSAVLHSYHNCAQELFRNIAFAYFFEYLGVVINYKAAN